MASAQGAQPAVVPLDVTWPFPRLQEVTQEIFSSSPVDYIVYATGELYVLLLSLLSRRRQLSSRAQFAT